MPAEIKMTPQELYDNYEYKIVTKALKREFPWILSTMIDEDKLNNYNLIFLEMFFNPFVVAEEYGWELARWTWTYIKEGRQYSSPYLSTAFDIPYTEAQDLMDNIEDMMKGIHKSPALPQDLKLPGDRRFAVGSWIIPAHFKDTHGIPEPPTP